ncbi:MAG: hypothetical protein V4604_12220 [Bacteroidota bacterium]
MSEIIDSGTNLNSNKPKEKLQGAGGALAMGIISIVLFGLIGLILAIITLSTTKRSLEAYRQDPDRYDESSYKQVNAGRTCAIVGLCLSAVGIIAIIGINAA